MIKRLWIFVLLLSFPDGSLPAQKKPRDEKQGDRRGKVVARPQPGQSTKELPRPLFVSGTVVLEDGNPLPAAVQVQLKCSGSLRQEVYTSVDGAFSFTLGTASPTRSSMDASIGGPVPLTAPPDLIQRPANDPFRTAGLGRTLPYGRVDLSGCHVEASLSGFQSDRIALGIRSVFDSPDLGAIAVRRLDQVQGSTVSLNTLNAPEKAKAAYEKATGELEKEKVNYPKVARHLEKAVALYPSFAAAWQLLGESRLMLEDVAGAREAFQEALSVDPKYVTPYVSLAETELRQNRWQEAVRLSSRALELNPYVTRASYCLAVAQYYLEKSDAAMESIRHIQESNEAHLYPGILYLLGSILAERRDYEAAASEFYRFLETNPPEELATELKQVLSRWRQTGLISDTDSRPIRPPG